MDTFTNAIRAEKELTGIRDRIETFRKYEHYFSEHEWGKYIVPTLSLLWEFAGKFHDIANGEIMEECEIK